MRFSLFSVSSLAISRTDASCSITFCPQLLSPGSTNHPEARALGCNGLPPYFREPRDRLRCTSGTDFCRCRVHKSWSFKSSGADPSPSRPTVLGETGQRLLGSGWLSVRNGIGLDPKDPLSKDLLIQRSLAEKSPICGTATGLQLLA